MDLRDQIGVLRAWARWIALGTILTALVAFVVSSILPKVYETDTRLLVGQALQTSNPNIDQFATAQSLAATYGELALSDRILEPVMAKLGISEPTEDFRDRIDVATSDRQPFIDITAQGASPAEAKAIVDGIASQLLTVAAAVDTSEDDVLAFNREDLADVRAHIVDARAEIAGLSAVAEPTEAQQARLESLQANLLSLRAAYASMLQATVDSQSNRLTVIDDGDLATSPSSPRPVLNVAIGAILGFLIMIAAAFTWDTVDDRIRSTDDVERVTGLGTIGLIMRMPGDRARGELYRLATLLYPRSPAAEAFRALRTNVEFASLDRPFRTIVVTSSSSHEGKTVVAANLAVAFAQSGRRVSLIDADLRLPGVHGVFGLQNALGLTDLARAERLPLQEVFHESEVPGLRIVTAGTIPANPAEIMGSLRMKATIARLRDEADLLIIDTPPVGAVTDAAILAAEADATILVIRESHTSERVARRGHRALVSVNANVVGVVLNFVRPRAGDAEPYFGTFPNQESSSGDGPDPGQQSDPPAPAPGGDAPKTRSASRSGDRPKAPASPPADDRARARPIPERRVE